MNLTVSTSEILVPGILETAVSRFQDRSRFVSLEVASPFQDRKLDLELKGLRSFLGRSGYAMLQRIKCFLFHRVNPRKLFYLGTESSKFWRFNFRSINLEDVYACLRVCGLSLQYLYYASLSIPTHPNMFNMLCILSIDVYYYFPERWHCWNTNLLPQLRRQVIKNCYKNSIVSC